MLYKIDTVCILCGEDKEGAWKECDYWVDENYENTGQSHEWNKEPVEIPGFKFTKWINPSLSTVGS